MQMIIIIFLICTSIFADNPFSFPLPIPSSEKIDFLQIQTQLRSIDIDGIVHPLYPPASLLPWKKQKLQPRSDFIGRISRGVKQTLVDPEKNLYPQITLHKINQGGKYCIVSFASFDSVYQKCIDTLLHTLQSSPFNGYFLLCKGGFPNPTGEEIRYAGVPYCFKIFSLLEAKKRGFDLVLWLDSPFVPLQDLASLFSWIEQNHALFVRKKLATRYLLPATQQVLQKETGIDMYQTPAIRAGVFGLDFSAPEVQMLIQDYYHLVRLGTPFLSCFPEEYVLGALRAKHLPLLTHYPAKRLFIREKKLAKKSITWAKEQGFTLLLQTH